MLFCAGECSSFANDNERRFGILQGIRNVPDLVGGRNRFWDVVVRLELVSLDIEVSHNQVCWKIDKCRPWSAKQRSTISILDRSRDVVCARWTHRELCMRGNNRDGVEFLECPFAIVVRFTRTCEYE